MNATLLVVALLLAADWLQAPQRQISGRMARGAIHVYQWAVSPFFAATGIVRCRYTPTCSHYSDMALEKHGFPKGVALTTWRLLRCAPWGKGGEDYP